MGDELATGVAFAAAISFGWFAIAFVWLLRQSGLVPLIQRLWRDSGPVARIAAVIAVAALSVYGGGKSGGTNGVNGVGAFLIPRPPSMASGSGTPSGNSETTGLRFTSFAIDGDRFDFSVAWPATNLAEYSAIDIFHKERLDDPFWRWICRRSVWPEDGETEFWLYGDDLPYWEYDTWWGEYAETNEVASPFGATYTNVTAYLESPSEPRSGFFMAAGQSDADGDGLPDAVERSLGYDPLDPDMDDDGVPDGRELALGADPFATDSDGDGLSDGDEVSWGAASTNGLAHWIDTSANTNRVLLLSDTDDGVANVAFPFPLALWGRAVTNLSVNANGLVGISTGREPFGNGLWSNSGVSSIPVADDLSATIAAFWDDLDIRDEMGSSVVLLVSGEPGFRTAVVEFAHAGFHGCPTNDFVSFQVQFHENETNTAHVVFSETSELGTVSSETIGARSSRDVGVEYPLNETGAVFLGLHVEFHFGLGSDPTKADTDGDGLTDPAEGQFGTDPCLADTDGDGLTDSAEVALGTDPCLADTDGDGIGDKWECDHPPFDPLDPSDGLADADGDGLSNAFEITHSHTDWTLSDTDGDGLSDCAEWNGDTDPLDPDCDGDGLFDGEEVSLGTDPCDSDSDSDGFSDGWEVRFGFDPLDDADPPPDADPDGDGLSNERECELGTNPLDADTDGDGLTDGEECGTVSEGSPALDDMPRATNILARFEDLDEGSVSIPLPFAVGPAWAEPCSNLVVGINGTVALATDSEALIPQNPSLSRPGIIHAFSDDLLACTNELGSSLSVAVSGTNGVRRFVLEYRAFGFYGVTPTESDSVSFRVSFREAEPDCVCVSFFRDGATRARPPKRLENRSDPDPGTPSDRALGSNAELDVVSEHGSIVYSSCRTAAVPGLSLEYRFGTGTSPVLPDTDGDGLDDGAEPGIGTNPLDRDSDRDGMDDGWEMEYIGAGFDPLLPNGSDGNPDNDAGADPDGDGLTNGRESELWTNPMLADTDGDGLTDGDEAAQGSDPRDGADTIPVKWVYLTGDLGQGVTKTTNATVTIPAGTMAFAGMFAFSEEYPNYTGQSSEYNDRLSWRVSAAGFTVMEGLILVNNEDGAWDAAADRGQSLRGLSPVVLEDKAILTAPGNADLIVEVKLDAENVSDGNLPSSLVVGFFPLKLVQSNMPTATGVQGTTDAGTNYFRAFIPTNGIAYITGQPAAPQLTAQFKELPEWIEVSWEMSLASERTDHRFNGIDDRTLQRESLPGSGIFDITAGLDNETVGGLCSLGVQAGGSGVVTYPFRIRGKNPLDATAKAYIDASVDAEFQSYAWMIAKHESKSGGRVYNQFNAHGDKSELPNFAAPSGWGIAQIDKGRNGDTTAEVYDWHENVASMNATLRDKRARYLEILGMYRTAYQNDPSTQWFEPDSVTTNVNGTVITGRQWAIMTLYNGAGGTHPLPFAGHADEKTPIHFDPVTTNWVLYTNSNNYVPVVFGDANTIEVE